MLVAGKGESCSERSLPTAMISCHPMPSSSQLFLNEKAAEDVMVIVPCNVQARRPLVTGTGPGRSAYEDDVARSTMRRPPTVALTPRAIESHWAAAYVVFSASDRLPSLLVSMRDLRWNVGISAMSSTAWSTNVLDD